MNRLLYILLTVCLLLSCSNKEDDGKAKVKVDDSKILKIGVVPSLEALPLMLAHDWEILDSMKVDADIIVYKSQIDAEQALATGKIDMAMSDMMRVGWWQAQKKPVVFGFCTQRELVVVPNKTLRITKIDQLDDHIIATAKFSMVDYYCDKVLSEATNIKGQILRPQINDPELRLQMLLANQLDAVILSPLQTIKAQNAGYKILGLKSVAPQGFSGFAYNSKSLKTKRKMFSRIQSAYNIAVGKLHKEGTLNGISEATRQSLHIDEKIDSLLKMRTDFKFTEQPQESKRAEAVRWLKSHGIVGASYSGDTLIYR